MMTPSGVTGLMPLSWRIFNYCKIRLQRSSLTCPASPLQRKPLKHFAGKPSQNAGFSIVVFLFINVLMNWLILILIFQESLTSIRITLETRTILTFLARVRRNYGKQRIFIKDLPNDNNNKLYLHDYIEIW